MVRLPPAVEVGPPGADSSNADRQQRLQAPSSLAGIDGKTGSQPGASTLGTDLSSTPAIFGAGDQPTTWGAATDGERVVFTEDRPSPDRIAHEAAHLAQWQAGSSGVAPGVASAMSGAESEADQAASAIRRGDSFSVAAQPAGDIHCSPIAPGESLGTWSDTTSPSITSSGEAGPEHDGGAYPEVFQTQSAAEA